MEQKKNLERKYLNVWIDNQLNLGEITVIDFEKPDFIINSDKMNYGIEITEFYNDYSSVKGSLSKREQSHLDDVWNKTRDYLKKNHPYHSVYITYQHTKDKIIDFNGVDIIRILDSKINYVSPLTLVRPDKKNLIQIKIELKHYLSGLTCFSTTDYNRFEELSLIKIIDEKTKKKQLWEIPLPYKSILIVHTSLDFSNNIKPPNEFVEDYSDYYSEWDEIILIFQINIKEFKLIRLFDM